MTEEELSRRLWGRTECPHCSRWVLCLALHQCSEEKAVHRKPGDYHYEITPRLSRWAEKEKA
jgi:hypothetical protein